MKASSLITSTKTKEAFYKDGILLPYSANKPEFLMTDDEKRELSFGFLRELDLAYFLRMTGFSDEQLCAVLGVTPAEFFKDDAGRYFNQGINAMVIDLAAIYGWGYAVFDCRENFNDWMQTPNNDLGGQWPLNMLSTKEGAELVRELILKIHEFLISW